MLRGKGAALAAIAVAALAAACSYAGGTTSPFQVAKTLPDAPDRGRTLYARDCAWCHASDGSGTERGPDLLSGRNGAANADFYVTTGRMPLNAPSETTKRSEPSYTPGEMEDIVAYTASLGGDGPDIPSVDLAEGDLGQGAELYLENCAACHSTTAIGGTLTTQPGPVNRSPVAPGLSASTPLEIAEAMLVGPGNMPVFGSDTFTDEEVNSIVRYVVYLQNPDDRGGAPLQHVGPVTEGALGWIVGLGALLLVARAVGTRQGED
jgi:ubiquinol-cytochrome c reductase cytochrome c subunit